MRRTRHVARGAARWGGVGWGEGWVATWARTQQARQRLCRWARYETGRRGRAGSLDQGLSPACVQTQCWAPAPGATGGAANWSCLRTQARHTDTHTHTQQTHTDIHHHHHCAHPYGLPHLQRVRRCQQLLRLAWPAALRQVLRCAVHCVGEQRQHRRHGAQKLAVVVELMVSRAVGGRGDGYKQGGNAWRVVRVG